GASSDVRQLQQLFKIFEQAVRGRGRTVAHHEVAERIDDVDPPGARGVTLRSDREGGIEALQILRRQLRDEQPLMAAEALFGAALSYGDENALYARHVLVQGKTYLPDVVKRLFAARIALCRPRIQERPFAFPELPIDKR